MIEEQIQRALDKILPFLASTDKSKNDVGIKLLEKLNEPKIYEILLQGISINDAGSIVYEAEENGSRFSTVTTKNSQEAKPDNPQANEDNDDLPF